MEFQVSAREGYSVAPSPADLTGQFTRPSRSSLRLPGCFAHCLLVCTSLKLKMQSELVSEHVVKIVLYSIFWKLSLNKMTTNCTNYSFVLLNWELSIWISCNLCLPSKKTWSKKTHTSLPSTSPSKTTLPLRTFLCEWNHRPSILRLLTLLFSSLSTSSHSQHQVPPYTS